MIVKGHPRFYGCLPLACLLTACGSDDLVDDPRYVFAIERVFADGRCGSVDEGLLPDQPTACWEVVGREDPAGPLLDLQPRCDGVDTTRYVVEPGRSRFYVGASFAYELEDRELDQTVSDEQNQGVECEGALRNIEFDQFPQLSVQVLVDEAASGQPKELEPRTGQCTARGPQLELVGTIPAVASGDLRMQLSGSGEPFSLTDAFPMTPPALEVELVETDAAIAAGVGTATLCVEAPQGFTNPATYQSSAGRAPLVSGTVALDTQVGGRRWGLTSVAVPAVLDPWTVSAFLGGLEGRTSTDLRVPAPLVLTAARKIDGAEATATPPGVTSGEPEVGCRSYRVQLEGSDVPVGATARLTTNAGNFAGGATELQQSFVGTSPLEAELLLPATIATDAVLVTALIDGFSSVVLPIDVAAIAAVGGVVYPPLGGPIPVGAEGSPARSVNGRLDAPGDTSFPAGFDAKVRVIDVTASPDISALACADPLDPSDFQCDPITAEGPGCAILSPSVSVSPEGSFTIGVPGGLCFAGTVTVAVETRLYDDNRPDGCLFDTEVTEVAQVATFDLEFETVPAP